MNIPALIKYVISRWNDEEDEVAGELKELLGNLHGETTIDENIKLPYARCAIELPKVEVHTGDAFLNNYVLLIAIYGLQNAQEHYQISKLLNKLLLGKNCRADVPDEGMHVLHILPSRNRYENIDVFAGRDILVSEHVYTLFVQSTNLNPD